MTEIEKDKEDKKDIRDMIVAGIVFLIVLAITHFVFPLTIVDGRSMMNTLQNGDIGITNTLEKTPKRGDIVIVKSKMDKEAHWVKRVIGLPGDTIYAKNGKVYINDKQLKEDYLDPEYGYTSDFEKRKLSNDEYFVMGDNRKESADSRMFGPFKKSDILSTWKIRSSLMTEINHWVRGEPTK